MTTYSGGEVVEIDVRGSRVATLVSRHRLAVEAFVTYQTFEGRRGEDILAPFIGKRVGGVTLETDPRVLQRMARRGMLDGGPTRMWRREAAALPALRRAWPGTPPPRSQGL